MATITAPPATRAAETLLVCGTVAGPAYVLVSVGQGLTRDGFDFTRHPWSLLANGELGWIQIANFMVTGLMTIALAVGLGRVHGAWAARLIGAYGVSLVAAGAFRADPAMGFPAGTLKGPGEVSWHGMLHFVAGGIGFTCLIAACLVVGRRFAVQRRRGWAAFSRITGVLFLAGFAGVASGAGSAALNLAFAVAVVLAWTWVSALAVHLFRETAGA